MADEGEKLYRAIVGFAATTVYLAASITYFCDLTAATLLLLILAGFLTCLRCNISENIKD